MIYALIYLTLLMNIWIKEVNKRQNLSGKWNCVYNVYKRYYIITDKPQAMTRSEAVFSAERMM